MLLTILLQITTAADKIQTPLVAEPAEQTLTFLELFLKGGPILIPIVLLSIVAFYIMFQKWFFISREAKINNQILETYRSNLKKGEIDGAVVALSSNDSAITRILRKGTSRIGFLPKEIEEAMETSANIEISKMSKYLNYLGIIAGIAPMLGFVGTIMGVIKIFYSISLSDNISIGNISEGLYEKMISSASGLVVGMIAYIGYHILSAKIDSFANKVEEEAFAFMTIIQDVKE